MKNNFFLILVFSVFCAILSGCSGKGEFIQMTPEDTNDFMLNEETGFFYVESFLEVDQELDDYNKEVIQTVAEDENIDIYLFKTAEISDSDPDLEDYGIKTRTRTLAYYQEGKLIGEVDFRDLKNFSRHELNQEVQYFIKVMKKNIGKSLE
ncbi:hypothetical protein [Bacillus sp. 37MA]|uniref:hypothetical protein n=1 Tax=Bacillus sp. 37MA TaxID=1132442 RepID=UPI00037276FE|nr:hypothetical protein [Bacillus sp. 37MA]